MPSNRWPGRFARALRDAATHAHMRAELLPRLPFVIALVVSAVALVVAIEHPPGTDAKVVSVDEEPSGGPEDAEEFDDAAYAETEVELEIVEQGFSWVSVDGQDFVLLEEGARIAVRRHEVPYPLLAWGELDPYRRLRECLGWSGGISADAAVHAEDPS